MRKKCIFLFVLMALNSILLFGSVNTNNNHVICATNDSVNTDKLIAAIIQVESKGVETAISTDGTCVGILQIKKVIVDDCNSYLGYKKYKYSDRLNKKKSIEMFRIIQKKYKNYKKNRSNNELEHMIRLWNGGCGYSKSRTQKYYEKVLKIYNQK